jgi:hypothetical protein
MRSLRVPTWLAVTALGCTPEAGGDAGTTTTGISSSGAGTSTNASGSTTAGPTTSADGSSTTAAPTTSAGTSTTDVASTTDGSSSGSTSDTDGLPDCAAIDDPVTCDATAGCRYNAGVGLCNPDCPTILDEATCVEQAGVCFWMDRECHDVAI